MVKRKEHDTGDQNAHSVTLHGDGAWVQALLESAWAVRGLLKCSRPALMCWIERTRHPELVEKRAVNLCFFVKGALCQAGVSESTYLTK